MLKVCAMLIYLLEATVYDPNLPGTTTLRYASGQGYNQPSAPAYYAPRIDEDKLVQYQVYLSADPRVPGPQINAGSVPLKDYDGAIKALIARCGVAGFSAALLIGDDQAAYGTFTTLVTAKLADPTVDPTSVTFHFQDRSAELNVPLGRSTFAGTNSLPTGTEGTASDVKGQYKPVAYGRVRQVQAPNVNSSRAVDQFHDGQISALVAYRDKGVALTVGASRTFANIDSVTDPSAGNADYFLGDASHGAYARRVASLVSAGPFTYDIDGDARGSTFRTKTADVVKEIVEQRLTSGPLTVSGDVTALNALTSAVVGFWNRDNVTVAGAVNAILPSAFGKWWVDSTGAFRMVQLGAPAGSPVANIRRFSDVAAGRTAIDADLMPGWQVLTPDVPIVWKVTVRGMHFWLAQTQGLDANIDQALRGYLQNEWRSATASDSSVLTQYPGAVEITVDTCLDATADMATLASTILGVLKVRRDTLMGDVQCSRTVAATIALGATVRTYDIMDYAGTGRLMTVLGLSNYDQRAGILRGVKVWG